MSTQKDRYHHGNLAIGLVEAALAMIEADGPDELSLRAVARETGVTASAVYRHFPDKQALLDAVAAKGFAALCEAFAPAAGDSAALPRLRRLGAAYIGFALARPRLYRLMFSGSRPDLTASRTLAAEGERAYSTLAAAVAACHPAGTGEAARTAATIAAWSLVHGYVLLRLEGRLDHLAAEALPDPGAILANLMPGVAG